MKKTVNLAAQVAAAIENKKTTNEEVGKKVKTEILSNETGSDSPHSVSN